MNETESRADPASFDQEPRYFAMTETDTVMLIPGATTFDEADDYCATHGLSVPWIFDEQALREFVASAQAVLGDAL